MSNNFISKIEEEPYRFYYLNEITFQEILQTINTNSSMEAKISTLGHIVDNDLNEGFAILKYDNSTIKVDLSRISKNYKISKLPYLFYGSLKRKDSEILLYANFYRILDDGFDFENYKTIIGNIRKVIQECKNLS